MSSIRSRSQLGGSPWRDPWRSSCRPQGTPPAWLELMSHTPWSEAPAEETPPVEGPSFRVRPLSLGHVADGVSRDPPCCARRHPQTLVKGPQPVGGFWWAPQHQARPQSLGRPCTERAGAGGGVEGRWCAVSGADGSASPDREVTNTPAHSPLSEKAKLKTEGGWTARFPCGGCKEHGSGKSDPSLALS